MAPGVVFGQESHICIVLRQYPSKLIRPSRTTVLCFHRLHSEHITRQATRQQIFYLMHQKRSCSNLCAAHVYLGRAAASKCNKLPAKCKVRSVIAAMQTVTNSYFDN